MSAKSTQAAIKEAEIKFHSLTAEVASNAEVMRDIILMLPKTEKERFLQQLLSVATIVLEEARKAAFEDKLELSFMGMHIRYQEMDEYGNPYYTATNLSKWLEDTLWSSSDMCSDNEQWIWNKPIDDPNPPFRGANSDNPKRGG